MKRKTPDRKDKSGKFSYQSLQVANRTSKSFWKLHKPIENDLAVKKDPEVARDRAASEDLGVGNDPEVEKDPEAVSDREVENDREVETDRERVQKVEIDHVVEGDQENDQIQEIDPFHESVYLFQEYDDHNEGQDHVNEKDQTIDQEIGPVIDQTIILFMIGKNRLKEKEADHVIKSLIENGLGKLFLKLPINGSRVKLIVSSEWK